MLFTKFLAAASLVATTIAQGTRIAFTVLPQTMTAGKTITLHWGGGDGSPVTLTLQQGTTNELRTVELVTGSALGYSYTWTVPTSLPNASNYAFRIQQGDTLPNYTGMITLVGGATGPITTTVASSTSSAASSGSSKASAGKGGAVVGGSKPTMSSVGNSTTAATTTGMAAVGSASATGTTMHRNTTMSKAKLSSTTVASTTSGSAESATSAGTAPSSTHSGAANNLAGNLALVVFAFAGVAYLG